MHWGSPFFVLGIIAMVMLTKIITTAIRAKHGYELGKPSGVRMRVETRRHDEHLANENERLKGMVLRLEERLSVLERIATDEPNRLSAEIERLR